MTGGHLISHEWATAIYEAARDAEADRLEMYFGPATRRAFLTRCTPALLYEMLEDVGRDDGE